MKIDFNTLDLCIIKNELIEGIEELKNEKIELIRKKPPIWQTLLEGCDNSICIYISILDRIEKIEYEENLRLEKSFT